MASFMELSFMHDVLRVFFRHLAMSLFALSLVLWSFEWLMPGFASPLMNLPMLFAVSAVCMLGAFSVSRTASTWAQRLMSGLWLLPLALWVVMVFGNDGRYGATVSAIFVLVLVLVVAFIPSKRASIDERS